MFCACSQCVIDCESVSRFKRESVKHGLVLVSDQSIFIDFEQKTVESQHRASSVSDHEDFILNLKYLYKRYIEPRSPYEVNISSKTRKKFANFSFLHKKKRSSVVIRGLSALKRMVTPGKTPAAAARTMVCSPLTPGVYATAAEVMSQSNAHPWAPRYDESRSTPVSSFVLSPIGLAYDKKSMEAEERKRLIGVLDEAIAEVMHLLSKDTVPRFCQTDGWKQLHYVRQETL